MKTNFFHILTGLMTAILLSATELRAASLEVTALHPLLAEMAEQVGGEKVEVINILQRGTDPHRFSPAPADLNRIGNSDVVLAMGKNFEPYLTKLRDNLRDDQTLVEVGRTIPSLKIKEGDDLFLCCPAHSVGAIDPHWWHSIANMQRAARIVATAFSKADPPNSAAYEAGAQQYIRKLDALQNWAKSRISKIPRKDRILATAHLAFGYFCKEFGFRAIGVEGLTPDHEPAAQHIEKTIAALKKEAVKAVFPERGANPKILTRIARDAGVKIGDSLDADGNASGNPVTYEAVVRHNVDTIVKGLE